MGLDISVYTNLSYVEPQPHDDEEGNLVHLYPNQYYAEQADGWQAGYYDAECILSFRAGSYSGYNQWREQLCEMALGVEPQEVWSNPELYSDKPFYSLINFADNEGLIGPVTSAKLLKNFEAFDDQAKEFKTCSDEDFINTEPNTREFLKNYFYNKYKEWRRAFEIASTQNGVVQFH